MEHRGSAPDVLLLAEAEKSRPEFAGLHILLHHGVEFFQDRQVPPGHVLRPGHQHAGVAPPVHRHGGHGGREAVPLDGHRVGDAAAGQLLGLHVQHPLLQEAAHVEVVAGGGGEHGDVAGPAHALVPLGAVGGDIHKVGLGAPADVGLELVEHLIGAGEAAVVVQVGVEGGGGDVDVLRVNALHAHIAEAHVGEPGGVGLRPVHAGVLDAGLGGAEKGGVQGAVRVENLGVADHNLLALPAPDVQPDHTGEILAEVVDQAVIHLGAGDGGKFLVDGDRRAVGRPDGGGNPQALYHCVPPAGGLGGGVVHLAVVQVGLPERALLGDLPGGVGADDLLCSVLICNPQLQQQGLPVGGDPVFPGEHKGAHRPAAGHHRRQGVVRPETAGHVVGLVLQIGLVGGKAGGEVLVPHRCAVEGQLVDAHGGGADFGLLHRAPEGEGLAEGHGHGGDLFLREGVGPVADPLPGPGGVQPPGLKFQGGPGGLPGVVHRRQLRPVSCKGLQGRAAVGDGHLPVGLHCPAVDRQNGLGQGRSGPAAVQGETEPGGGRVGHAVFPLIFTGKGSDGEHMQPAFLVLALVLLSGPSREKKLLCPGRFPRHSNSNPVQAFNACL